MALNFCPFAAPVLRDETLRIAVASARHPAEQLKVYLQELDLLQQADERAISTTLLVYENGPAQFTDFLALVESADAMLDELGLRGIFQTAHFHPDYYFAGEPRNALSHYTNRSPLPTIHLLREAAVTRLVANYPDPETIPKRNMAKLESLGREAVLARWRRLRSG